MSVSLVGLSAFHEFFSGLMHGGVETERKMRPKMPLFPTKSILPRMSQLVIASSDTEVFALFAQVLGIHMRTCLGTTADSSSLKTSNGPREMFERGCKPKDTESRSDHDDYVET